MAQLTDDCFAFSGPLLPLVEMERLITERVSPVAETEIVSLLEASGRVLAADLIAAVDLPPFDNSAVDGYAVRHADLSLSGETKVKVIETVFAGKNAARVPGASEAIRIFTGAPMPAGADTVFMQEDVQADDDSVVLPAGLKRGSNRRLAGEDIKRGAIAIAAGTRLSERHVALAAAIGATALQVRRRVRVALFSTGDEIVEPGAPRAPSMLYDANRYLLAGLLTRLGAQISDLGILPDDEVKVEAAIAAAAKQNDLVLTSGGVSAGEADFVKTAVEKIGKLVFWRVGIKPGRPVAMGVINGSAFAGLPGNPVAVFVTFARVVRPLLLRLAGATKEELVPLPVRVSFPYKKKQGRREYVRVSLRRATDGVMEAVKFPQDGAGVITSLTDTDGLLEFYEDETAIEAGSHAGFLSYAALTA